MLFTLLDYGSGNLLSAAKALEAVGATVCISDSAAGLEAGDALVLPGVGAFGDCVEQLHARGFWDPVASWLRAGRPFLGICVGYQLLFESSEESPGVAGFGHFAGRVRRFPDDGLKVPHIGWNQIVPVAREAPLWRGVPADPHMYFVHSFYPEPSEVFHVAANCHYGRTFAAASVGPGPLLATQFHPEKSQAAGLALLRNFVQAVVVAKSEP